MGPRAPNVDLVVVVRVYVDVEVDGNGDVEVGDRT
jgi:hypothetical protein